MINTASLLFTLLEQSNQIYFAYNLNTKTFIYVNPAFESFFRVTASEASIHKLFAMVHPADKNHLKQNYRTLQPSIFRNNIGFRVILPDRKECFLQISLLIQGQESNEHILTGYMEDLSEIEAHNRKLNEFSNKKKFYFKYCSA